MLENRAAERGRLPKRAGVLEALQFRRIAARASIVGVSVLAAASPTFAETRSGAGGESYRLSSLDRPAASPGRTTSSASGTTVEALEALFAHIGYHLDGVRKRGIVPRLLVREMPGDLPALLDVERRKAIFIRIALPLILATNEAIARDRARIERLRTARDRNRPLSVEDVRWLWQIFVAYKVAPFDFDELLRRVDIVPPSLAIAQAAEESGWGTSRFVRHGNALFGERIYRGTKGMVPSRIAKGHRFRVRSFGQLFTAVVAYASNLNTHPAYRAFRAARSAMRAEKGRFDAPALAAGLEAYSERRQAYIATLRAIIRTNALTEFDRLRLDSGRPRFAGALAGDPVRVSN